MTIDGAPDRDHAEHVTVDDIVDVKSSGAEKQPPSSLVSRGLVQPADVRALREEFDSRCKFFFEKVGRLVPPVSGKLSPLFVTRSPSSSCTSGASKVFPVEVLREV